MENLRIYLLGPFRLYRDGCITHLKGLADTARSTTL